MQLVLSKNRVIAHGENFLAMGGTVINTVTGAKYENATVAECDGCPSDIDSVGYEYHAGQFVPCAPYGKGNNNGYFMEVCTDCATPRNSGIAIKNGLKMENLNEETVQTLGISKRTARFTVGTSVNGWTKKECDYLCDGTDDNEEINAAIKALPASGGEIVILDGTYNIASPVLVNKANVTITGCGKSTKLLRVFEATSTIIGIICVAAKHTTIKDLYVDGTEIVESSGTGGVLIGMNDKGESYQEYAADYSAVSGVYCTNNTFGIFVASTYKQNNVTISNCICYNNTTGIMSYTNKCTIENNRCTLCDKGIWVDYGHCAVIGNICYDNVYGIYSKGKASTSSNKDLSYYKTITGNNCYDNTYGIYADTEYYTTITGNNCCNNYTKGIRVSGGDNVITGNLCYGASYGIVLNGCNNSAVVGNYAEGNKSIYLMGAANSSNVIYCNRVRGSEVTDGGGFGNQLVNNYY